MLDVTCIPIGIQNAGNVSNAVISGTQDSPNTGSDIQMRGIDTTKNFMRLGTGISCENSTYSREYPC
jgi:hypothetical protein